MTKYAKRLFKLSNIVPALTIILGFSASKGFTDQWFPPDKVMMALLALVSIQLLIERIAVIEPLSETLLAKTPNTSVNLLSRTEQGFEHFPDFVGDAKEVMVIGVDLAFMAKASAWFIKESLNKGVILKLLLVDPNTSGQLKQCIYLHDERNTRTSLAHDHIQSAQNVIDVLKTFADDNTVGSLEIRAREGIPSPSLTLVDPSSREGKIRVELKLYKRNQGSVPYFTLTRDNPWYSMFYEHYYNKLWNDSRELYSSAKIVRG